MAAVIYSDSPVGKAPEAHRSMKRHSERTNLSSTVSEPHVIKCVTRHAVAHAEQGDGNLRLIHCCRNALTKFDGFHDFVAGKGGDKFVRADWRP